jgi:hypothetical protein
MIKSAAQKPPDRMHYISTCLNVFAKLPQDACAEAFKVKVESDMMQVRQWVDR